jgi:hypothetical protein
MRELARSEVPLWGAHWDDEPAPQPFVAPATKGCIGPLRLRERQAGVRLVTLWGHEPTSARNAGLIRQGAAGTAVLPDERAVSACWFMGFMAADCRGRFGQCLEPIHPVRVGEHHGASGVGAVPDKSSGAGNLDSPLARPRRARCRQGPRVSRPQFESGAPVWPANGGNNRC